MNFTYSNMAEIRLELEQAMKTIAEAHNIEISIGTVSFDDDSFGASITGVAKTHAQKEWNQYALSHGFTREDFNRDIRMGRGNLYTIVGWRPRAKKYPVLLREAETGETLAFSVPVVQNYIRAMNKRVS